MIGGWNYLRYAIVGIYELSQTKDVTIVELIKDYEMSRGSSNVEEITLAR